MVLHHCRVEWRHLSTKEKSKATSAVRNSALKGREFDSLGEVNTHLRHWETATADHRIHGTTRKQVGTHFQAVEKPALQS